MQNIRLEIYRQPEPRTRFRYRSDGRAIRNAIQAESRATRPIIRVVGNLQEYAHVALAIRISCVMIDPPHHPHPNTLHSENSINGTCEFPVDSRNNRYEIPRVSITRARKVEVNEFRQNTRYTGEIDTNAVRLCFQLIDQTNNRWIGSRQISNIIRNDQASASSPQEPDSETNHHEDILVTPEIRFGADDPANAPLSRQLHSKANLLGGHERIPLELVRMSTSTAPAEGGARVLLFCKGFVPEEEPFIRVVFREYYEMQLWYICWEGYGDIIFHHSQYGIEFLTPTYTGPSMNNDNQLVNVIVYLFNSSTQESSNQFNFQFTITERIILGVNAPIPSIFRSYTDLSISLKPPSTRCVHKSTPNLVIREPCNESKTGVFRIDITSSSVIETLPDKETEPNNRIPDDQSTPIDPYIITLPRKNVISDTRNVSATTDAGQLRVMKSYSVIELPPDYGRKPILMRYLSDLSRMPAKKPTKWLLGLFILLCICFFFVILILGLWHLCSSLFY